jgi:hypothetical protein
MAFATIQGRSSTKHSRGAAVPHEPGGNQTRTRYTAEACGAKPYWHQNQFRIIPKPERKPQGLKPGNIRTIPQA